ncbi:MAG: S8 family serine peptidase [Thermomicrobiales bacterium]
MEAREAPLTVPLDQPSLAFVPDEICIVIDVAAPLDDMSRKQLYGWNATDDSVRRAVNVFLGGDLLIPLERRGDRNAIYLDNGRGTFPDLDAKSTRGHLYYRLALDPEQPMEARMMAVRETVMRINFEFGVLAPTARTPPGVTIRAAMPNWLAVGSGYEDDGGPAAPPEPVAPPAGGGPTPNWRFRFSRSAADDPDGIARGSDALQALVDAARANASNDHDSIVIVAVLDTKPADTAVDNAAVRFGDNFLLQQITGRKHPDGTPNGTRSGKVNLRAPFFPTPAQFAHLRTILPVWLDRLDEWYTALTAAALDALRAKRYAMPDHGLFSSGIIKDIAPDAQIHLIQAMDDAGVTDMLELTDTLSLLPFELMLNPPADTRLVVNLSLTFSVETCDDFLARWFAAFPAGTSKADAAALYDLAHRSLKDVIDWLDPQRVLVVAAVGNYNVSGLRRPDPRYPAQFDNVLGVAAISRELRAARFTNRGDERARRIENGIATFGGDVTLNAASKPVVETEYDGSSDAIQGVFSATDLPFLPTAGAVALGGGSNQTGWVRWVGTSFSTPIISALAALLWKQDSRRSAAEVMAALQGYADPTIDTGRALGCDTIFAEQVAI